MTRAGHRDIRGSGYQEGTPFAAFEKLWVWQKAYPAVWRDSKFTKSVELFRGKNASG